MIKIIRGVYGVNRLTSQSAPFVLSEKEEARLVALGVAEYVEAPANPEQGEGENPGADENGEQGENPGADNQYAGEDQAPAETVKQEAPEVKAEKQTKGKGKGKKAAKK